MRKHLSFASLSIIAFSLLARHVGAGETTTGIGAIGGGLSVTPAGTVSLSVPMSLPPARGGVPIPLRIVHDGSGRGGELGVGWSIPFTYVEKTETFAHTRPKYFADPNRAPEPLDRIYLSLDGAKMLMVPVDNSGTYRPMVGPQTMTLVDRGSLGWRLFDGSGHTFDMTQDPRLAQKGMWLLTEVNDATTRNPVRLTYGVNKVPVGDDSADELELRSIEYNFAAGGCAKNRIALVYRPWLRPQEVTDPSLPGTSTGDPFALWSVGGALRARTQVLDRVEVLAHGDTCGTPDQQLRLRAYSFTYAADTDTGSPRLIASDVLGRQGTAEENQRLPIGRYDYGSATTDGKLQLEQTQTVAPHPDVAPEYQDALSVTLTTRGTSDPNHVQYKTIQAFLDLTGDGRADMVFNSLPNNRSIATGENLASGAGDGPKTGFSSALNSLTTDLLALSGSSEGAFSFGDRFGIQDTNVQLIDFNADGRIDILKSENPDYWTLELNVPASKIDSQASPNDVVWSERRIDLTRIREELNERELLYDPDGPIPLSRVFTGMQVEYRLVKDLKVVGQQEFQNVVPKHISIPQREVTGKALTAWALRDINGDGYPDFVFAEYPVRRIRYEESDADCQDGMVARKCSTNDAWDPDNCVCKDRFDLGFTDRPEAGISAPEYPVYWSPAARESRLMVQLNEAGTLLPTSSSPFGAAAAIEGATGPVEEWDTKISLPQSDWDQLIGSDRANYDEPNYAEPAPEPVGTVTTTALTSPKIDSSQMAAGLIDINGDGIADRVGVSGAKLGTGLSYVGKMSIPGLPSITAGYSDKCRPDSQGNPVPPDTTYEVAESVGYVDLTGDGIPDFVDGSSLRPGTGAGWGPPIPINIGLWRRSVMTCGGKITKVVEQVADIDGDGRVDDVEVSDDGGFDVWRTSNAAGPGAYNSARLVAVDNGYGARTRVEWVSAKNDVVATHRGLGPEIVVSRTVTSTPDESLVSTQYAYGDSGTFFDAAADHFVPTGFERRVTMAGINDGDSSVTGAARIVDSLQPQNASSPYEAYILTGLTLAVHLLDGHLSSDPWKLLRYETTSLANQHGEVVNQYDVESRSLVANDCVQTTPSYDPVPTVLVDIDGRYDRPCTSTGFAYPSYTRSWRGESGAPGKRVMSGQRIQQVDDMGRPLRIEHLGDLYDDTDDVCEQIEYAGSGPYRIYDAASSRTLGQCADSGGDVYSRVEIQYDEPSAGPGSVTVGLPTTVTSRVYETTGGNEQSHLVTKLQYDSWGNVIRREQLDGTVSRVTTLEDWGGFMLAPRRSVSSATGVAASFVTTTEVDPYSLVPTRVTGPSGTTSTVDRDGFGRQVAVGVVPAGELTEIMLAQTAYTGFEVGASRAPEVRRDSYQTASGQMTSSTTFLDALGRAVRSEQWLGDDYSDTIVTRDVRFDAFGRPKFVADAYPAANPGSALYGTTYHYRSDGSVECAIRAPGEAPLVHQTDEDAEVFPTCFDRTYLGSQEIRRVQGPNELLPAGPQTGGWSQQIVGATGRVLEKSRWYAGQRKELARFYYDPLGGLIKLDRYAEPGTGSNPVTWSFVRDSAGRALVLSEPSAAPRFNNYDAWGNLVSTNWEDPNGAYQVSYEHDALGRLLEQKEMINGIVQPETVVEYAYDEAVLPGYQNVKGRLAASYLYSRESTGSNDDRSPIMRVAYGYDELGRVNAISRLGEEGQEYRERYDYRLDGQLSRASFELPDTGYATESAAYRYDSAGRLDGVSWEEGGTTQELFQANEIDPFGRYLHVTYGNGVEEQNYYKATNRRQLLKTYLATPTGESRSTSYTRYSPDLRVLERMEVSNGAKGTTVENSTYQYDSLYQLTRASAENAFGSMMRDEVFTYDGLGNTRSVDDVLGSVDSSITMRGDDLDRVCRTEADTSGTSGTVGTGGSVGGIAGGGVLQPSDGQTRLWVEAETGVLSSPMRFATDSSASLGAYIEVPPGSGNNAGSASYLVKAPAAGTYYVWLRVRAASTADDSYTISLSGKSLTWNAGAASDWSWRRVDSVSGFLRRPVPFYLNEGNNRLILGAREDGVQVDRLLITTDAYTDPRTSEPTASPTNIVVEAESGVRQAPWGVELSASTSAGAYLAVPKGQPNQSSPDGSPTTTVDVSVPENGYYAIWARVLAPDAYTNSFFVQVDHNGWWTWHIPTNTAWQTRRVYNHDGSSNQPVTVWLTKGEHTIAVGKRESGTGIDTIIVTNQFGTSSPTITPVPAPDDCQYRYDAQGNVTTIASSQNPTRNFQYDLHGRVTSMVAGSAIGKYRYGPDGKVMTYVQGGTGANNRDETHYGPFTRSWFTKDDQSVELIERHIPGVPIVRRGTGPDATVLYGHIEGPGLRRVTDETGAITQELEYRAYGGVVEDTGLPGDVGSLWEKFGAGDHLEAFGVVHMGARLYDPRTGRFLQRDPLIIPRSTTMMNPYAFAWNDPINFADPTGLDPLGLLYPCDGADACAQRDVRLAAALAILGYFGTYGEALMWDFNTLPARGKHTEGLPQVRAELQRAAQVWVAVDTYARILSVERWLQDRYYPKIDPKWHNYSGPIMDEGAGSITGPGSVDFPRGTSLVQTVGGGRYRVLRGGHQWAEGDWQFFNSLDYAHQQDWLDHPPEDYYLRGQILMGFAMMGGNLGNRGAPSGVWEEIPRAQRDAIQRLRSGRDITVKTVEEARSLLRRMPELRPATQERLLPNPTGRMRDGFADPPGTFRGDLINKADPYGPIHPGVLNADHADFPHYNIKFPNGQKATIIIKP